jgi:hypothetical protein
MTRHPMATMRSTYSTSRPLYHDMKKSPYSLRQLPQSGWKKPVCSARLQYVPLSCGPAYPHSGRSAASAAARSDLSMYAS